METAVIKTYKLTKQYGKKCVVNEIDMCIHEGEIYGLVGKNGAGKTTLMRLISGLSISTSGSIELFGKSGEKELTYTRQRIGGIIEIPAFFPYLSARKNLEYYRIQRGIPNKACVDEVLEFVGLSDAKHKKFKNFSLGMKQRLGLALAIMGSPDLLILDEPINGLDPTGIVEIREILKRLNQERHMTIIISSHILGELSQLATRYGFIHEGKLIEEVTTKEIEEKCRHYLSLKVDDLGKATVVIEDVLKCSKYEILGTGEIKIFEYIDTPEIVAKALVEGGVMIYGVSQVGSSLEQYFMDLIGGNSHA